MTFLKRFSVFKSQGESCTSPSDGAPALVQELDMRYFPLTANLELKTKERGLSRKRLGNFIFFFATVLFNLLSFVLAPFSY